MVTTTGAEGYVFIEFLSVPRSRTGVAEARVPAGTLGEILKRLQQQYAGLHDLLDTDGRLASWFRVAGTDGRFITDTDTFIPPGSRLLLLSADLGG